MLKFGHLSYISGQLVSMQTVQGWTQQPGKQYVKPFGTISEKHNPLKPDNYENRS